MKNLEKLQFLGTIMVGGMKEQLKQGWTWSFAVCAGLYQGLKYKGDFKNGALAGAAVLGVLAVANGFYNIALNGPKIKRIFRDEA